MKIDAEERDEWVTATCSLQRSLPSSLTKAPCAVWLAEIVAPYPTQRVAAAVKAQNDTLCAVIVPRQAAVAACIDEPTAKSASRSNEAANLENATRTGGKYREHATGEHLVSRAPWPCRVPADPERWILGGSGQCSSTAELVRPRRLVYAAPSANAAEIAVGEALNQHRATAVFLTTAGAIGVFAVTVASAYACYWQALHTCAEVMIAKRRGKERRKEARRYRERAGEGETSEDESYGEEADEEWEPFRGARAESNVYENAEMHRPTARARTGKGGRKA